MGMSTHVVGFKPADEKWERMKAAWDACESANVEPPKDVVAFFEGEYPGDQPGMEVRLKGTDCLKEWHGEYRDGYELDVTKLPKDVKVIRFYNSY